MAEWLTTCIDIIFYKTMNKLLWLSKTIVIKENYSDDLFKNHKYVIEDVLCLILTLVEVPQIFA